jgi:iron complex outermembrane receptor protein
VVQAVPISIQGLDTDLSRTVYTDQHGRYAFESLPTGRYRVTAARPGFQTATRDDVIVSSNQETTLDISLGVANYATSLDVTAPPVLVTAEAVLPERVRNTDTASLLANLPGLSIYGGGGVSSLPVIHGLDDDRVNVLVNGMSLESACANHMNPPLSYTPVWNVGLISVMAGITPVSSGGDSTGGTISVEPALPEFAGPGVGVITQGSLSAFHRSNGVVNGGNLSLSTATENYGLAYTGSYVNANNYKDGTGVAVKSTFYESTNHSLQLSGRRGGHVVTLGLGFQYIPQQGFVNARMDMTFNNAKFANLRYTGAFGWGTVDAHGYYEHSRHEMNILRDKIPGMFMPMETRGTNLGYSVQTEILLTAYDTLLVGNEYRRFHLDDWWPPVMMMVGSMGPDTFWNINNGRRDRFGTYIEWAGTRSSSWTTLLGVRSDVVRMNTDDVVGYNMSATAAGSAAYYADAMEFNALDHDRLDNNFDVTALARYQPQRAYTFEFGYARKTRSPNLYERYLWVKRSMMSVQMNGWFGDANGYTGNLDLRPEVANTFSATFGWRETAANGWALKITPYYTRMWDYIDVDRCPLAAGGNGCTAANLAATIGFVNLQFANHDSRLFGVDGSGRIPLGGNDRLGEFVLNGTLGYVHGRNLDTGDNLYNIMPVNAKLTLEHRRGDWTNAFDFQAVDRKREVQGTRNELRTPGYALLNLRTSYELPVVEKTTLRIDAGIDNLANRSYTPPLGGRYWIGDKTGMSSVPGVGRTFFGGLTIKF